MDTRLEQILNILKQKLEGVPCTVILFGSRVKGSGSEHSDFDIAIEARGDLSFPLSLLREELDQSNIPQKVDLVDLNAASLAFRSAVMREGEILWKT